jgi:transcriptional regulator with XRE-family HTH domain
LAVYKDGAKGLRLPAVEALQSFGWEVLLAVAIDGAATISDARKEPAETIKAQREKLHLSQQQVATFTGLTTAQVEKIEQPGKLSPIRDIAKVAVALALDERVVGFEPQGRRDNNLGVRLREMAIQADSAHFDASTVLRLSDAAWVIRRQNEIAAMLKINANVSSGDRSLQSTDYGYPTYEKGYRLAERARRHFNLDPAAPILSLRSLLEEQLGYPLVQDRLSPRFAGATIANGGFRGIVVNEVGHNTNVWVRRMTLAHELGHLIGDPDGQLNALKVDEYDAIVGNPQGPQDRVEMRANSFAIAFLAPPVGVKALVQEGGTLGEILSRVTDHFGISRTAASWHIKNVTGLDTLQVRASEVPEPSDEWIARENLTLDYYPLGDKTPLSRRGRFSFLVAKAFSEGIIGSDSAALWLGVSPPDFEKHHGELISLWM